jgi:uncharacterized membrane protein YedE/YeeE
MNPARMVWALIAGVLFGFGLSYATMIRPEVVLNFLTWRDFGLLLVLGGAVCVALLAYQLAPRLMDKPWFGPAFGVHESRGDARTLVGAAIFGIGWGLCGVCPGPAIAGLGAGNWPLLYAVLGMFAGAWTQGVLLTEPEAYRPPA